MLLAVAADKFRSSKEPPCYEVLPLGTALERRWESDAHCVGYLLPGHTIQPASGGPQRQGRLLKIDPGAAALATVLMDFDNPGHALWTDGLRAEALELWPKLRAQFPGCGIYSTNKGWRLVLPLRPHVPVARGDLTMAYYLGMCLRLGAKPDLQCRDWTRHFRMPFVLREGQPTVPWHLELPTATFRAPRLQDLDAIPRAKRVPSGPRVSVPFAEALPAQHAELVARLGAAMRDLESGWHEAYLALAGALLKRGIHPGEVPALVEAVAHAEGSIKPDGHRRSAEDTCRRFLNREGVTGERTLQQDFPSVWRAISTEPRVTLPGSAQEAATRIAAILRAPGDGVTIVQAPCGTGKTRATEDVFLERLALPRTAGKSVLSVPRHDLALQVMGHLTARGAPVRRLYSPLSVIQPDGRHACIHAAIAGPLAEAGQSVQKLFCPTCEVAGTCQVKDGADGPTSARIVVGTHARLPELVQEAGLGLLVVDEPPPGFVHRTLTTAELAQAGMTMVHLRPFQPSYTAPMVAAFEALASFDGVKVPVASFFPRGQPFVEGGSAPPLRKEARAQLRQRTMAAMSIAAASRLCMEVWQAIPNGTVEVDEASGALALIYDHEGMRAVCRKDGPSVALDANGHLRLPEIRQLAGYEPRYMVFEARDGGRVVREILFTRQARRAHWLSHHQVDRTSSLLRFVKQAVNWTHPYTGAQVAVITWKILHDLFRAVLAEADEWPDLAREIEPWRGAKFGYYGALTGMDTMKDADVLVTLGDPFPNVGQVRRHATRLQADERRMLEAEAAAQLEQAHGRLRTPHRTREARCLHVGSVVPTGEGWEGARMYTRDIQIVNESSRIVWSNLCRLHETYGTLQGVSVLLGVSVSTVRDLMKGRRSISAALARRVEVLITELEKGKS